MTGLWVAAAGLGLFAAWRSIAEPRWTRDEQCKGYEACAARCEAGVGAGCHKAGLALRDGDYVARDPLRARQLFEKGCELGSEAACDNVVMELRRTATEEDARALEKRSFELRKERCDAGRVDDCYALVFDLRLGWNRETKEGRDEGDAASLRDRIIPVYERFCSEGDAGACYRAGRLAKGFAEKTSADDHRRALPHYERACTLDPLECWSLGSVKQDLGQPGRADLDKACDADEDGSSCWDPLNKADPTMAAKRLTKREAACAAGKRTACLDLVYDQWSTTTPSAATPEQRLEQRDRIRKLLGAECDRGQADSCSQLASMLALDPNGKIATGSALLVVGLLHEKACIAGDANSCFQAGLTPLLKDVEAFYPGVYHHCATKRDGRVTCFGSDVDALGVAKEERSWREVTVPLREPVVDMALTAWSTCALGASGNVSCWGQDLTSSSRSSHVPSAVDDFTGARALHASEGAVCAELPGDKIVCRGGVLRDEAEKLEGPGTLMLDFLDCVRTPKGLRCREDAAPQKPFNDVEVTPAGGKVEGHLEYLCSLYADGTVACGEHAFRRAEVFPKRVELQRVAGIDDAVEISVSRENACARRGNGSISCWKLPNGEPKKLEGIDDATQLTGACATTKRGYVFCWGGRYDVPWGVPEVLRVEPGGIGTR